MCRGSNNILEYLAEIVSILASMLNKEVSQRNYVHSCTDTTSAIGWMCKSNFSNDNPTHLQLSRHLTSLVLDNNICSCSQHVEVVENVGTESLSRDFYLADALLPHFLSCFYPKKLPPFFNLCLLLSVITSYIIGILDAAPAPLREHKHPTPSAIGDGLDG